MSVQDIRVLSIFSGGGGLDIGFHQAGYNIVACLEIDKPSCDTLELNRGNYVTKECRIFNEDITKVDPAALNIGRIDFIIGGPPCQSFSAAGRRAGGVSGINDTRGSLFWYYCKFLEHFQPEGFLFENVRGILQANKAKDWEIIKESFRGLGYNLYYRILDAADYGVPQHRERVILVGSKNKEFNFPRPTHGPDSKDNTPHVAIKHAFQGLEDPEEKVIPYGGKWGHLLADIPPGLNYSFYTEKMGHPEPRFAWRSKFSGFLYKLDPEGLSKTIVAHQGRYDGPFHWKNRKLNLAELKRVQGFPDDYKFVESKVESTKQIGNSVSPKMAFTLAKAVKNTFFNGQFTDIDYIGKKDNLSFDKRKGIKAKKTKAITKIDPTIHSRQSLFSLEESDLIWPSDCFSDEIEYFGELYNRQLSLSEGIWTININKQASQKSFHKYDFSLNFVSPVNASFNKINCSLLSDDEKDIVVAWDAIHLCVAMKSHYENLSPLYGHFTEPYPKFTINFQTNMDGNNSFIEFIQKIIDYDFLSKNHKFEDFKSIFSNDKSTQIQIVQNLRLLGFDIRVYETNRAIPEGQFMVCYPYALPNIKSYTTWHEKGTHKTKDLMIQKTENGYAPIHIKN